MAGASSASGCMTVLTDAVWSYETPYPESQPVQGLVSFWGDDVVVSVTSV